MQTLTCAAFLAIKSNGEATRPNMIMVTNDHRLWLNQTFASIEHLSSIDTFHIDPKKPYRKLFSLLVNQLKELQLSAEGDELKPDKPFSVEAEGTCIGGVIRCFRPEEGPYALRLPLYGSREHALIGGFANRASAVAWILTVESALSSIGILSSSRDWYQVLPA